MKMYGQSSSKVSGHCRGARTLRQLAIRHPSTSEEQRRSCAHIIQDSLHRSQHPIMPCNRAAGIHYIRPDGQYPTASLRAYLQASATGILSAIFDTGSTHAEECQGSLGRAASAAALFVVVSQY